MGVAGWYSSKKARQWASYAAGSSEGRTAEAAVKPWRNAFCDERCLPESVRGPVECRALARLMAARSAGARWGDVIGVGDMGRPRNWDSMRGGGWRGGGWVRLMILRGRWRDGGGDWDNGGIVILVKHVLAVRSHECERGTHEYECVRHTRSCANIVRAL